MFFSKETIYIFKIPLVFGEIINLIYLAIYLFLPNVWFCTSEIFLNPVFSTQFEFVCVGRYFTAISRRKTDIKCRY